MDAQPGEKEMQSIDARPSDAINLAVRCKVRIRHKRNPSVPLCLYWLCKMDAI